MSIKPRAVAEALVNYRPGGSETGKVKLSSNESAAPPSRTVLDRLEKALSDIHRYPAHDGRAAREAFANRLGRTAEAEIGVDRVIVGSGSVSLLRQIYEAFVAPGDEVVVGWPSFEAYPVFSAAREAAEVRVPLVAGRFNLAAMADAVTDRTRVVIVTTPNNPTGSVIGHEDLVRFVDGVPSTCLVVIDHAYAEFDRCLGSARPLALIDRPNVVVLRTLSKAYALAGLRIGFGIGHPEVIAPIDAFRAPFEVNALAQAGAIAALEGEPLLDAIGERDRCAATLWAGGLPVGTGQGNFVWIPASAALGTIVTAMRDADFVPRSFEGEGVRVSLGTPDQNDGWVASVLAAWRSKALADVRAAAAGPVADLVERWRARGIDLAVDAGTGRQDLDLQAETFALAEAIWPATGGTS